MGCSTATLVRSTVVLAVLAAVALAFAARAAFADHDPGATAVDILAIDADPTGNTATHVETIDECVSLAGVGSSTTVDIIADQVPDYGVGGVQIDVLYNPAVVHIIDMQGDLLMAANEHFPFNFSEPRPDTDGDFRIAYVDLETDTAESGEGVLIRLTIEAVGSGTTTLLLDDTIQDGIPDVLDPDGVAYPINNIGSANVVVGQACASQTDLATTAATISAPASADANIPFDVVVGGTIVNNGPADPANADVVVTLGLPGDCTAAGGSQITPQDFSLGLGAPLAIPDQTFSVTCTAPSFHGLVATVKVVLDDPLSSESALSNNQKTAQATTAVTATADVEITGISVTTSQPTGIPTIGISFFVHADVNIHDIGPAGPVNVQGFADLSVPADCGVYATDPFFFNHQAQTSVTSAVTVDWMVVCQNWGDHTLNIDAEISVPELHVIDPPGNNTGAGSTSVTLKVGVCGPDPEPAGSILQELSPALLLLISQLTAEGEPAPEELQTPFDCDFDMLVRDQANTPNDECAVQLVSEAPCSVQLDLTVDIPGGSPAGAPTMRLNPVGVSFLPAEFDWANDTEVPNGTLSGGGLFSIRTDAGLLLQFLPCTIDIDLTFKPGYEGGIVGNVPESNSSDDLLNPHVWPNDLNAERALVENIFTVVPGVPGVELWSRTSVDLELTGIGVPLNILTWKVTDPGFQVVTGAEWIIVPFPGDAVNPDPPGTIGGDPDADDPPPSATPLTYCAPHHVLLTFNGMAGDTVFLSCTTPGSPMGWNLVDPDALNITGDEGPRSDTSDCGLDLDNDGLGAGSEAYWGTDPANVDSDADGVDDAPDNCKMIPNTAQENYDGDLFGDVCDDDVDGDGVDNLSDLCPWTVLKAAVGPEGCSKAQVDVDGDGWCDPNAPGGGPDPCTPTDNCPTTPNADQANADGDAYGDVCDGCVLTSTPWTVPQNDSDCDGFADVVEAFIGTLGGQMCADSPGQYDDPDPDAWPTDFNDDQMTDGSDVLKFGTPFGHETGDPEYSVRFDFSMDGRIDGADVLKFGNVFLKRCA